MGLSLKSTSSKVLASAALLAAAAGVAGMGTYGGFTASTSASAAVDAATVTLTGADAGTLSIQAAKVIPGDTMERTLKLVNGGTLDLAGITLTTTAGSSNLLTTDANNGLQLKIDSCPVAWTGSGTGRFTCSSAGHARAGHSGSRAACRGRTEHRIVGPDVRTAAGKTDFLRITMDSADDCERFVPGPEQQRHLRLQRRNPRGHQQVAAPHGTRDGRDAPARVPDVFRSIFTGRRKGPVSTAITANSGFRDHLVAADRSELPTGPRT